MAQAVKTIFLFERGINGWQGIFGDWKNWPNAAIAWVHNQTPCRAQTLLYFVGAVFAALTRRRRATQFAQLLHQYLGQGWQVIIVAHSEGTATVLEALKLAGYPAIQELHLLCGAASANCERNGINHLLARQRVHKLRCYVAGKDWAMKTEDTVLGKWFFGIRTRDLPLGLAGPTQLVDPRGVVQTVGSGRWQHFGHSSCFTPAEFDATMKEIFEA